MLSLSFTTAPQCCFKHIKVIKYKKKKGMYITRLKTHSSTLAWKIPWTEEPGRLQSMGSQRVGHDWGTSLSLFTFMHWRRKWQPTPVFLPGESQGRGSLAGCHPWGRTVRHDLSNLAAAAADSKARMFFSQRERCTQRKVKEYKN